jgi:galactose oxidase-like protein
MPAPQFVPSKIRTGLLALALTAGSLTCGGDITKDPEPKVVEPVAGDGQTGLVGQPLPDSLIVLVRDTRDQPMPGITVAWTVNGGGSVSQPSTVSGADGRAAVQRVLGGDAGTQATSATVPDLPPAVFTATAQAPTAAQLVITTQPGRTADNGIPLVQQPVLRVDDASSQPFAKGVEITASVEGASLSGTVVVTSDGSGVARFSDLTLTGPAGNYMLVFSAPDLAAIRSSTITLALGAPAALSIVTQPPHSALDREVFSPDQQPVVRVTDAGGNPLAGATVNASIESGSSSLEGDETAITGDDGQAAFGDLGISGIGRHTIRFSVASLDATSTAVSVEALPTEAAKGQWGPVISWAANGADIVPLHIHLLPTGKVLAWGKFGHPWVWTPPADGSPAGSGSFREVPIDTMLFCGGHAFLPDGRLLVSGGHLANDRGLAVTYAFDPFAERWTGNGELPDMAWGRWYPTVTTLADGRAVTVAGRDSASVVVGIPELWDGSGWIALTGASKQFPYYPRDFVAPDGRVFYAGERIQSWWLEVDATSSLGRRRWTAGPSHIWPFNRDYGSAVMYRPGKILYVGGGGDPNASNPRDTPSSAPTNTAEIIDLNRSSPSWTSTGSMQFARRHLNATILPDGDVLVTGGTGNGGFNDVPSAVHASELWQPETGSWITLASSSVNRGYHSVSLLLPNGTVLHGGSGDAGIPRSNPPAAYPRETSHEIFSPPYLFRGKRPTITSAPGSAGYGQTFNVDTPYAAQVTEVSLIRLGSVTHAFDQNTRFVPLTFSRRTGHIRVTAPTSPNLAPPGHYLLFILNRNGVPSEGEIIELQ